MEYCNKDAYLWSILPTTGIVSISPDVGTFTNLPTIPVRNTKLYGIPYEDNYTGTNGALRIITFTSSSINSPVRNTGPILYLFSGLSIYDVKWKVLNAPSSVKVGFYTSNWLPASSDESKYYLFATDKGLSLYNTPTGQFRATSLSVLSVIIEGNYPVELEVSYCNPPSITYPDLQLYLPVPYGLP